MPLHWYLKHSMHSSKFVLLFLVSTSPARIYQRSVPTIWSTIFISTENCLTVIQSNEKPENANPVRWVGISLAAPAPLSLLSFFNRLLSFISSNTCDAAKSFAIFICVKQYCPFSALGFWLSAGFSIVRHSSKWPNSYAFPYKSPDGILPQASITAMLTGTMKISR